jgi:hypothetical protein
VDKGQRDMSILMGRSEQLQIRRRRKPALHLKKAIRIAAVTAIVLACVLVFTLVTSRTDYISYWGAGQLLMHHSNPYSPAGAVAVERPQGLSAGYMIMLNPPWALFLAAPLGFGGIRVGMFLWTLATVSCVFISAQLLDVPSKQRAFAYVFAPAVAAVFMGQSSAFLLLGVSLFLCFHRSHPFFAGASLLLMAIKPHLFLVFWALLLVDCLSQRRFRVLVGFASALAAATGFAMCFDPHVCRDYVMMLRSSTLGNQVFPTISMLFRILIDPGAFWLLFVPSALGILWALWYYRRNRRMWDWRIHGMLLLIVCILVSPYSWFTDEAVLLPSILFALRFEGRRKHVVWILLAINTAALWLVLGRQATLESHAYAWTPLTWLAWFLYAVHRPRSDAPAEVFSPVA